MIFSLVSWGKRVKLSASGVRKIILMQMEIDFFSPHHFYFHHADTVNVTKMACLFTRDPVDEEAALIHGELHLQ